MARGGIPGFTPLDTVDFQKASANEKTAWVKHACWPTEDTLAAKRYAGDVRPELQELRQVLEKVLREGVRPTHQQFERVVPLVELWDGSDYLLLKYTSSSGFEIAIQDGRTLFVKITLPEQVPLSEVESLVASTVRSVFELPSVVIARSGRPKIWRFPEDIGPSRVGMAFNGSSPLTKLPDWYSSIGWWSDGSAVLFLVSKFDYDKLAGMGSRPPDPGPRRFRSRIKPPMRQHAP
jgi:hypothetical protein